MTTIERDAVDSKAFGRIVAYVGHAGRAVLRAFGRQVHLRNGDQQQGIGRNAGSNVRKPVAYTREYVSEIRHVLGTTRINHLFSEC
jgi:hypothetical protein